MQGVAIGNNKLNIMLNFVTVHGKEHRLPFIKLRYLLVGSIENLMCTNKFLVLFTPIYNKLLQL